ncbi:MAG: hypothetical protein IJ565_00130 [Bacilli bacterium]|nr:hypothetical protein [Bacilli bacterium]
MQKNYSAYKDLLYIKKGPGNEIPKYGAKNHLIAYMLEGASVVTIIALLIFFGWATWTTSAIWIFLDAFISLATVGVGAFVSLKGISKLMNVLNMATFKRKYPYINTNVNMEELERLMESYKTSSNTNAALENKRMEIQKQAKQREKHEQERLEYERRVKEYNEAAKTKKLGTWPTK